MAHEQPLTTDQFAALAELCGSRGGATEQAMRLILTEGVRPAHAAQQTGLKPQAINDARRRYEWALERARRAAGPSGINRALIGQRCGWIQAGGPKSP